MSFIPLLRGEEAQDDRPLSERSLEQGCCFVLLDGDGAFADEAGRRFINYLLQPVELLSQTQLPDEYARILSVAQGMLPQWNHRPVDFGGITAPFNLRQPVIISTFQQPELVELAGAIRRLLERWHIRAEIRIDAFDSFNSQPRPLRISGSATLCSIPFRFRHFWNGWLPPRCLRGCLKPATKPERPAADDSEQ